MGSRTANGAEGATWSEGHAAPRGTVGGLSKGFESPMLVAFVVYHVAGAEKQHRRHILNSMGAIVHTMIDLVQSAGVATAWKHLRFMCEHAVSAMQGERVWPLDVCRVEIWHLKGTLVGRPFHRRVRVVFKLDLKRAP